MKRILTVLLAIACFYGCEKTPLDNNKPADDTFESHIKQLYGDYTLSDIQWPGLNVNMNYDDTGNWNLLHEFKNKVGYYEPDYVAHVGDGIIYEKEESYAEFAAAFNVTIPYPNYILSDGKWLCKGISSFKMTIRATEKTFRLYKNCCWIYPGHVDHEDLFLANIKDFSIYVESFNDKTFKVGVHCILPSEHADGTQKLNENILYYTFVR